MELKGRRVQFAIEDIYYPPFESVLGDLHRGELLRGEVVDTTDAGAAGPREPIAYAVVRVDALDYPVIVPVGRVRD